MGAQLRINTSSSPKSLIQMTGTEWAYTHHQILTSFASSNTGVGTVSVNPASNSGLTLIGTFTDSYRNFAAGAHPIGTTITEVVYNFFQNQGSASESGMVVPLEYGEGTPDFIIQQSNTSLNADSIAGAIANLVASGLGSYAMQPTAPAGGTWTAEGTITNNLDNSVNNVTYLWRKTATTAPGTTRPVKLDTGTSPFSIKEMDDTEIRTLAARLRNQIIATGIGTYKVQSATPSPGTWVTAGAAFSDTTRTASDQAYGGSFTGAASYTGIYSRAYSGVYNSPNYTGVYAGASFAGGYAAGDFAGNYVSPNYTRGYTGGYAAGYVGGYTSGPFTGTYFDGGGGGFGGPPPIGYDGSYVGATYYGTYYGPTYFGTYQGGAFNTTYTRLFTRTYTGSYTGSYTGTYSKQFTGAYTRAFTGVYTGTAGYGSSFTGLTLNNDSSTVTTVSLWLRTA